MDERIFRSLKDNWAAGGLRRPDTRKALLKKLRGRIKAHEDDIIAAERADFNKCAFDVYATEISLVYGEIDCALRHLSSWARPRRTRVSLPNFPARCTVTPEAYGVVLVIAPWNYPFQLALAPLVGAVAAGNCAVVKPASATAETARVIGTILRETFAENEVYCETGGRDAVNVLDFPFDRIFFTGGAATGRKILRIAAERLTPVVLELGGKSPCIVDRDCDVRTAARRIAWAKFLNAGQTCVAPDYLYLHEDVYDAFIAALVAEIRAQYYEDGALSRDFAAVITEKKAESVRAMLQGCRILFGGSGAGRVLEPTVIEADQDSPFMREEIFAPVLPVLRYSDNEAIRAEIAGRPRPLALYYFGRNPAPFTEGLSFGGGCVNDAVMHVTEHAAPFGGVGASGMGRYHGKYSFEAFSHCKTVLYKSRRELKLKYPPHTEKRLSLLRRLLG